jgi:endonuclease/exonuclease/phosphatase family metal-dependent hydrolase
MRLLVASRTPIDRATSWPLPRLHESPLRRQFNLTRQVLECVLPIEGGGELALFNTHLSAFSRGDGTLDRQVHAVLEHTLASASAGRCILLAGDFNSLPPSDDPARLGAHAELYAEHTSPLVPLYEALTSAVPDAEHAADPARWYTYLPFGENAPDRAIDHAFVHGRVEVQKVEVLTAYRDLSDHLPLRVTIVLAPLGVD